MAYKVIHPGDLNDHLPSRYGLSCYDTLEWDERWWSHDWDELLYRRSEWEVLKQQGRLGPAQIADLARIDRWWRARPQAFNRAFGGFHQRKKINTELAGWVEDERGRPMPIPQSHWWWWPLPEKPDNPAT